MRNRILRILTGVLALSSLGVAHAADYTPAWAPGGWRYDTVLHAPNTSLDGLTVQGWAQAIDANTTTAGDAIPKTWIGANTTSTVTGVAPLDADKNVTSNLLTSYQQLSRNSAVIGQILGTYTDPWTPPWMARLGGLTKSSPFAMQVNGLPDGPNDSGSVLAVSVGSDPFSSIRPGIGPDGLSNGATAFADYSNLDGAAFTNQISTPIPPIRVGQDIVDWNGTAHTLEFDCDGNINRVCFSPALPSEWVNLLHRGQNIVTNVIGPGVSPADSVQFGQTHPYKRPNILESQVYDWASDGSYVDTVGWAVPGSGLYVSSFIPGTSSYTGTGSNPDVSAGELDTVWSSYSHPALFIGADTAMYNNYSYCSLNHSSTQSDISSADSMVHACLYLEHDIWNYDADYLNSYHGVNIGFLGPNKPADGSDLISLSGSHLIQDMLRLNDPAYGGHLITTNAGFDVKYAYQNDVSTLHDQKTSIHQEFNADGTPFKIDLWSQRDALPADESTAQNRISVRLGLSAGGSFNDDSSIPTASLGQIIFNPREALAGLCLAGGVGGSSTPTDGICVQQDGTTDLPHGAVVQSGSWVSLNPSSGTASGTVGLYGSDSTTAMLSTTSGAVANLTLGGALTAGLVHADGGDFVADPGHGLQIRYGTQPTSGTWEYPTISAYSANVLVIGNNDSTIATNVLTGGHYIGALTTPASSTAACTAGEFTDDSNYHYVCVAANTWKRVALSTW